MQINMTTFAGRREQYVGETVRSLLDSEWIETESTLNLILGSEDDSHVRQFADHPRVRIVPWDVETNPNIRWNCTLNKIRALRRGDDGPMVIVEDDIQFTFLWLEKLKRTAAELEGEYVLSLFTDPNLLAQSPLVEGKTLVRVYPHPTLQGAQAVYYPSKAIRNTVASFLRANLMRACGDDLIGQYARQHAALYSSSENLVDNIGAVSCFPT